MHHPNLDETDEDNPTRSQQVVSIYIHSQGHSQDEQSAEQKETPHVDTRNRYLAAPEAGKNKA
jgi:hypothetical protein